ncbi:protein of unknown function [Pararobbsia alpina]
MVIHEGRSSPIVLLDSASRRFSHGVFHAFKTVKLLSQVVENHAVKTWSFENAVVSNVKKQRQKGKGPHFHAGLFLEFFGSPTWARTRDLRINSPALYQLSYRGTAMC